MNWNDGYHAAEEEIVKWLRTQLPVPVCAMLANRIVEGAHRPPEMQRPVLLWEIPISIEGGPAEWDFVRAAIGELGAFVPLQLCGRDEGGGLCVVPMAAIVSAQAYAISAALSKIPHVERVGDPIGYPGNEIPAGFRANMKRAEEIFCFLAEDEEAEGLVAERREETGWWVPFVGIDRERMQSLRERAQLMANDSGQRICLVRFSAREVLEVIDPEEKKN